MQYTVELDNILESIFSSYLDFVFRRPDHKFQDWAKNKNARKKFKTLTLFVKQGGKCYHCPNRLRYDTKNDSEKTSLDRVLPGSHGGTYHIENVVLACLACNKSRGDKSVEEFATYRCS